MSLSNLRCGFMGVFLSSPEASSSSYQNGGYAPMEVTFACYKLALDRSTPALAVPTPSGELPKLEAFRPFIYIITLPSDVVRPLLVIAADLLHEKRDPQVLALIPKRSRPQRIHRACASPRLAPAGDPIYPCRNNF